MLRVFQHGCRNHFNLGILHDPRVVEIREILVNHGTSTKTDAVEAVIHVKFDRINISQSRRVGLGATYLPGDSLFTTAFETAAAEDPSPETV